MTLQKGDFVLVTLETKEQYKGQIKDIEKEIFKIEICTNKKKSEANEIDCVEATRHQIKKISLFG